MNSINVKTVAIKADVVEESQVLKSEVSMEQEMKKQNRGKVIMIGAEVSWPLVGMDVSFLRNATTPFKDEDGEEYLIINKAHVIAEFGKMKK